MQLKTAAQMRQARADSVKEDSVEGYFIKQAKRYRCKQRKLSPLDGVIGWPDRLLVWPAARGIAPQGAVDFVELKRPKGGRFQPKQEAIQEELRERNCNVETLYTREQVDEYFRRRAKQLGVKPVAAAPRTKRQGLMSADEFLGLN